MDIKKMFKYQNEEIDKPEYEKYLKYLTLFFQKDFKKNKYNKEYLNGEYILIDKTNPKKKIFITPSEFININELYIELKEKLNNILFRISSLIESKNNITDENREEFEILKKDYINFRKNIEDITEINNNFYKEISDLLNEKINKSDNLVKYYKERNVIYSTIEIMIPQKCKNKLIKSFKENNNKIPSLSILNKIAKEYDIPSKEIEKWIKWIEIVYFYILSKMDIERINNDIYLKETNFLNNTNFMIIKKPEIKE
jgi:hypothetical protein